jgi:hypothetical protein
MMLKVSERLNIRFSCRKRKANLAYFSMHLIDQLRTGANQFSRSAPQRDQFLGIETMLQSVLVAKRGPGRLAAMHSAPSIRHARVLAKSP